MIEAPIEPWPPFTFCCPQAIVDQDAGVSIPNISLLPLDEAPVHAPLRRPRPFAIRKAPSARVESIEPRPPQPCEVGRPKGRRRKSRRQSHIFFSTCCASKNGKEVSAGLACIPTLRDSQWSGGSLCPQIHPSVCLIRLARQGVLSQP